MASLILPVVSLILFVGNVYADNLTDESTYSKECPGSLLKIKAIVLKAILKDRRMGASLLRLHFHDCFVNGCDGSVLLDNTTSTNGEKFALPNINSLRGFEVIDEIKSALEEMCPKKVSCADILAVAARDSVALLAIPLIISWEVKFGRKDSLTASMNAANTNLPPFFLNLDDLVAFFHTKGFTAKETVALSGGHTIGKAHCPTFRDRIHGENQLIDAEFAKELRSNCPKSGGDTNAEDLDDLTPITRTDLFDNNYFKKLIAKRGLLHSDQQLYSGNKTVDAIVESYSKDMLLFFKDFGKAMVKMSDLPSGAPGEIRKKCSIIN